MTRLAIDEFPRTINAPRLDRGAFAFPAGGHNGRPYNFHPVP